MTELGAVICQASFLWFMLKFKRVEFSVLNLGNPKLVQAGCSTLIQLAAATAHYLGLLVSLLVIGCGAQMSLDI